MTVGFWIVLVSVVILSLPTLCRRISRIFYPKDSLSSDRQKSVYFHIGKFYEDESILSIFIIAGCIIGIAGVLIGTLSCATYSFELQGREVAAQSKIRLSTERMQSIYPYIRKELEAYPVYERQFYKSIMKGQTYMLVPPITKSDKTTLEMTRKAQELSDAIFSARQTLADVKADRVKLQEYANVFSLSIPHNLKKADLQF